MLRKGALFCFLLLSISLTAQIGGRHTYQFLNLTGSPREAALGGKNFTGYGSDPTSALYNPASINYEMKNQLALNYVNYLADINYGTASYAFLLDRRSGIMHTGVTYINYGTFDGYDENGNETGEFSGNEVALTAGYAFHIPDSKIHLGVSAKLITSQMETYNSIGGALDLGITYYDPEQKLVVSGVIRNLGTQFKPYDVTYESLPFEMDFGISQELRNMPLRWHLTLENIQKWNLAFRNSARDKMDLDGNVEPDNPGFFDNLMRHVIVGAELFPERAFSLRAGYSFRRSEELRVENQRSFAGLSGGISVRFNKLRFSYTYARYNSAASSSFFGLNIDLDGN